MPTRNNKTRIAPKDENTGVTKNKIEAPFLIVVQGNSLGRKYNLDKREIIIGRSENVEIRIDDENVSRCHAKIFTAKNKVSIVDQDSTNGTFVNTKRSKAVVLKDNDMILIGNTILKFFFGDKLENAYHDEIYRLATLDGLTQIYNKKFLLERLQGEFSRCKRYRRDLSLVMFDLDHFKVINDIYGHQAGDYVLKRIASLISKNLRKEDIFGRYGGEEFTIMLPETDGKKATLMAEKLRKLVENAGFRHNDQDLPVTISAGVTSFGSELNPLRRFEELIEQADNALYRVKNSGRNRVAHFLEEGLVSD